MWTIQSLRSAHRSLIAELIFNANHSIVCSMKRLKCNPDACRLDVGQAIAPIIIIIIILIISIKKIPKSIFFVWLTCKAPTNI